MQDIATLLHQAAQEEPRDNYFPHIKGFLTSMEGYTLSLLAALGPGRGEVVEIGSYLGRSTCYLAMGCKTSDRGAVTAVDHFQGSPEHQQGKQHEEQNLIEDGSLLHRFRHNVDIAGLAGYVRAMPLASLDAAARWPGDPIRLLFIDGDHSYEDTRADFQAWIPYLAPEGLVAFHDVGGWEGVTRFYKECIAPGHGFSTCLACESIRVVRRSD